MTNADETKDSLPTSDIPPAPEPIVDPNKEREEFQQLLDFLADATDGDGDTTVVSITTDQFAEETFIPTELAPQEDTPNA